METKWVGIVRTYCTKIVLRAAMHSKAARLRGLQILFTQLVNHCKTTENGRSIAPLMQIASHCCAYALADYP